MKYSPLHIYLDSKDLKSAIYHDSSAKEIKAAKPRKTYELAMCRAIENISDMTGVMEPLEDDIKNLTVQMQSMHTELNFLENDRFSIFPDSVELINAMLRAKINMTDFSLMQPPAEVFAIMMPKGYRTPEGYSVPSFLVQWKKREERYNDMYAASGEIGRIFVEEKIQCADPDEMMLEIQTLTKDFRLNALSTLSHDIKNILDKPESIHTVTTRGYDRPEDTEEMNAMIKIAISTVAFNSAYEDFLIKGFPKGVKPDRLGTGTAHNSLTMGKNLKLREGAAKAGHIRSFHFRQLRNPRYYQGEHAHKPIGSRWVPVSESWVGDEIDAHTTNSKEVAA